jgi:hypothetical protein
VRPALNSSYWAIDVLVVLGVVGGVAHAWDVLDLAHRGMEDDDTWGLMHLPMHGGFALAVPVAAAVAVIAMANGVVGWKVAIVPPAVCAAWFGVVSLRYPDHIGSLDTLGGTAAVTWGVLLLLAAWGTGVHRLRQSAAAR